MTLDMTGTGIVRYAALVVGILQAAANALSLARAVPRIRAEMAGGAIAERFADLLSTAWVYGALSNLCLSGILILLAGPLRRGNPTAWRVSLAIGLYYVVVGVATYGLGIRRHPGLLFFVILGLVLVVPLWFSRAAYSG